MNSNILGTCHLLANGRTAVLLRDTLHCAVTELADAADGGYQDLLELAKRGSIDHIVVFGNPIRLAQTWPALMRLLEYVMESGISLAYSEEMRDLLAVQLAGSRVHVVREQAEMKEPNGSSTAGYEVFGSAGAKVIRLLTQKIALLF